MGPKKQRQRKISEERILAAKVEVQRLLDANIIREIIYPEWLANVVLVPKKIDKMRMCIDFIDLNKSLREGLLSHAKDRHFSRQGCWLPKILIAGLLFTIPSDLAQERRRRKNSFTTPFGTYCYTRMPEGLKNARATFTRMIKKVLGTQL
jgi:hypothetical protein